MAGEMIVMALVNLERRKPDGFAGVTAFSPRAGHKRVASGKLPALKA
jgi:hypothetical protein